MNLFKRFLASLSNITVDERKQAKDASFIQLAINTQKLLNRSLTAAELSVIYGLDDHQTEIINKLISEAEHRGQKSTR